MRRLAACLFVLLLSTACLADSGGHPVTMWLVEGETNRVYLLGSVHLLRREDHPLPDVIDTAYDDAEALYMEIDMDDLDPLATQAVVNRLGMLDDTTTLRDVMGETGYAEASKRAEAVDIPLDMLSRAEPWYAAITVEQLALMRIGFDPTYGVELHLTNMALQDGKPVFGFETVEEQLLLLDGLSHDAQRDLLLETLVEAGEIGELMDELIVAWRTGDVAFLRDTMLERVTEYPELYDTVVADRNRRWVETIERMLTADDDYLVVVGALHLIGPDGLPALLGQRGHAVRQARQGD